MGRTKGSQELKPTDRARICELNYANGWGAVRINKLHPEWPVSTISYTLRKEKERSDNASIVRSGRPAKLSEAERDRIADLVRENPNVEYKDIIVEVDHKVKKRSVRRLLDQLGLRKSREKRTPVQHLADRDYSGRTAL
jgi:transposase